MRVQLFTWLALLTSIAVRVSPAQVSELPPPTGPASIGVRSFHWVDSSRSEPMTTRLDDRREVAAFLWYPAAPTRQPRASYVPDSALLSSGYRQRYPTIVSMHQHGFANAPIDRRTGPLPVLLFSPGGGLSVTSHLAIIEDLVSHGFVVLGVQGSFDGYPIRLSDGRVAISPEFTFADVLTLNRNRADARALDLLFALRQLERLNAGSPASDLRGRLDLTRVGAFGHSRGGLAAAEACKREPRLRGCLNYDGHYLNGAAYADTVAGVLSQPFMSFRRFRPEPTDSMLKEWKMSAQDWATNRDTLEQRARRVIRNRSAPSYLVTIDGATHLSFSDQPLLWAAAPVPAAPRARPHEELLKTIREYTRDFFDLTVRGGEDRLSSRATPAIPYGTTPPFIQLEILPPHEEKRPPAEAGAQRASSAVSIIDSIAAGMYAADSVGGVSVGVIRGDSLVWSRGYGWANAAERVPVSAATVFRIGSITKQFTAVMFLQLASERRVQLGDPVEALVPSARRIAGWNAFRRRPSLFELATHTSGLSREPEHAERYASGPVSAWESRLDSALQEARLLNEPGTRYRYSNIGYALLGQALGRAANEPYVDYVERRILVPLGMRHTAFVYRSALGNLARGYAVRSTTIDTLEPAKEHAGRGFRVPNGALYSTVEDMARFIAFELGHGPSSVLPPAVLDSNFRRHVFVNAAMTDAGGLGFVTVRNGTLVFQGHAGDVAGYQAYAVFDRRSDAGMVVLRNVSGGRFDSYRLVVEGMRALAAEAEASRKSSPR